MNQSICKSIKWITNNQSQRINQYVNQSNQSQNWGRNNQSILYIVWGHDKSVIFNNRGDWLIHFAKKLKVIFGKLGNLVEFESDVDVVVLFLAAVLNTNKPVNTEWSKWTEQKQLQQKRIQVNFQICEKGEKIALFQIWGFGLNIICFLLQIDLWKPKMLNNDEQGGGGGGMGTNEEVKKYLWCLQHYFHMKIIFERAHFMINNNFSPGKRRGRGLQWRWAWLWGERRGGGGGGWRWGGGWGGRSRSIGKRRGRGRSEGGKGGLGGNKHLWYLQEYLHIKFIFERAHLKCTVLMVL